jgi:hypothetical protein
VLIIAWFLPKQTQRHGDVVERRPLFNERWIFSNIADAPLRIGDLARPRPHQVNAKYYTSARPWRQR